ncbi:MAG: ABC transporter ATP-binding protein [Candidatus Poribacteria bacterium]|nr:ABC transporter ATP-binding protein [Candidatus Poribacteria bacterium]
MSDAPIIDVRNLTKRFGDTTAVDHLSLSADKGEILGLLGPNGAGKTTTIQMMLGLTTPTEGDIRILGMDIKTQRRDILQRSNFSSAYISLPTNLTAWENLNVFGRLYGIKHSKQRIQELLDLFEIPHVINTVTGALSTGQLTRLNLCKAFLNDPDILFLDEPTASLDPDIAEKVRRTLANVQAEKNVTMIYTSHNMREVELVCDRVIFMAKGRIVTQGTPKDVLERAQSNSLEDVFISIARDGELKEPVSEEEDD